MPALALLQPIWQRIVRVCRAALASAADQPRDYPFVRSDVARFHQIVADPAGAAIDDQTWNDLLLDRYSDALGDQTSIFGRQMLHHRLRAGLSDADCAALGGRLAELGRDHVRLAALHADCRALRKADTEIGSLLFAGSEPLDAPAWSGALWLLPLALLVTAAAGLFWMPAWFGSAAVLVVMVAVQAGFHQRMERWDRLKVAVQALLRTSSLLGDRAGEPLLHAFHTGRALAGKVNRGLTRSAGLDALPVLKEYDTWFLLGNVRHYLKSIALVARHQPFLRAQFLLCANFEADLALARHLATARTCRAERHIDAELALTGFVHPLLAGAAPLSLATRGAFISGQNGIGKSTLLRALGLNLVAARAFGFCYAQQARVPVCPVYTSMQSEDSLLGGESLYLSELRRARELLASSAGPQRGIYLIDEIFRGTNHQESVAAASAVLDTLAASSLVIVSSHNLVLASLLKARLEPWCVSAQRGKLALLPGVLAETNGIALLATRGFDAAISAKAGRVFDWLGGYLAQPADCSEVV